MKYVISWFERRNSPIEYENAQKRILEARPGGPGPVVGRLQVENTRKMGLRLTNWLSLIWLSESSVLRYACV